MMKEYLELLNKKLESLQSILKATRSESFTGEGEQGQVVEEAERFANLYEHRANVIAYIKKLDAKIASKQAELKIDEEGSKEINEVKNKIKETAKILIESDKMNIIVSQKMQIFLKGNLKKMRDGKGVSAAYADYMSSMVEGSIYDQQN